jgi:hypothetical protein
MLNQPDAAHPNTISGRAGMVRVVVNALLVLLAFEIVSLVVGMAQVVVRGTPVPLTPVELLLLAAAFALVRWVVVLPLLLPVLVALELVGRRISHARVLTAVVAVLPIAFWQVTQSSGDISGQGVVLGLTAALFVVLARLPAASRPVDGGPGARERSSEAAVNPR